MEPYRGVLNIFVAAAIWTLAALFTFGFALVFAAIWAFLVFSGSAKRESDGLTKVQQTLMPGETLQVAAVQHRPFALWARRKAIGMTDSRIIIVARGLFGGFTMRDLQWKDLQDAELCEQVLSEVCGTSLSFAFRKGDYGSRANRQRGTTANSSGLPTFVVGGIPSEEARIIYSNSQAQEHAWEEKRRVRAIEETRAAAGGVYVNTPSPQPVAENSQKSGSLIVEELSSLKKLLDTGVISDAEFQEMKAKVISRA